MRLGLSLGSLHTRSLEEACDIAADAGFDGVEVMLTPHFGASGGGRRLLQRIQRRLPVLSLHAPLQPVEGWGDGPGRIRRTAELAAAAGVPLITFHPPGWLGGDWACWRWLNRIDDFQQQIGLGAVTITLENMPRHGIPGLHGYRLSRPEALLAFLQRKNLYLTFDTAHMGTRGPDILPPYLRFAAAGRVRSIHLSDLRGSREHLLPGHGQLPLAEFVRQLGRTGYDHGVVVELMPRELPAIGGEIRHALRRLAAALRSGYATGAASARGVGNGG